MNWLAHIFLSEQNIDFQIGNYLHDPLKGKSWDYASDDLNNGMKTHMLIDLYTDSHFIVAQSKARLREKGLLKAIVIDMTYDYFLTKNWDKFSHIPFEDFTEKFYKQANLRLDSLPEKARESVNKLIKYNILNNYKSTEHLKIAFERFDKRLSTKLLSRDSASSYFETVTKNIEQLEEDFLIFFPKLSNEVKKSINLEKIEHWKI